MKLTRDEIRHRHFMRRGKTVALAAVAVAAIALSVSWVGSLVVVRAPVAQGDKPIPPPHQADWKLASYGTVATWEPNAARNSRDLYAAYEQARELKRADAWLVAAEIADLCYANAIDPNGPMSRINQQVGEYNSTKAGAPERDKKLAELKRQAGAVAELRERCKGFQGKDFRWMFAAVKELRKQAKESDSDVGRLMRATVPSEQPNPEYVPALNAALASGNPVLVHMAIYSTPQSLFDAYKLKPDDPDPPFSAFGALLVAQERIAPGYDRNDLIDLAVCAVGGWCDRERGAKLQLPTNWTPAQQAQWESVVQQYEDALRANDVKKLLAVRPS